MGSRERPASALDTDHVGGSRETPTAALAAAAEADATAAEAEARAAAARVRAIRLRRQAMAADHSDGAETADPDTRSVDAAAPAPRWWRRRPGRKVVAVAATITLICASFAASGYMMWHHHIAAQEKQHAAEFATAARQAVTTLMSLDFSKSDQDLKRIADISTGRFKDGFPLIATEMRKRLQQSKAVTTATVNDVAVESMTGDSATVLVAATTTVKSEGAQEPQSWHIALGLRRDAGQPKISSIEFVQ